MVHTPPDDSGPRQESATAAVVEFAAQLREMRKAAGSPSFRHLAGRTHYSSSTLAEATAGKRLPTEAVVKAFVNECGGDADEWVTRLRQAAETARQQAIAAPPEPDIAASGSDDRSRWRVALTIGVSLAIFALGAAVGTTLVGGSRRDPEPTAAAPFESVPAAPTGPVSDGADPIAAGCVPDAALVDKTPVMIDGQQVGALELEYSGHCQAAWARLYLYPGQPTMMGLVTVKANDGRQTDIGDRMVRQIPVYTNVVALTKGGCIGAQGSVLETGHPLVTVSITCQAPAHAAR